MELNGSADSVSKHNDEHAIPPKTVGGVESDANAVLAMFSGESIHGGRVGEGRIGEKLDGRRYGPGSYFSSKTTEAKDRRREEEH